jgi:mRNA-degrading endonuclease RelE of RelBE toxin-antitoxin system
MTESASFTIVFDPQVTQHLRAIESKHHSLIRETIDQQLQFEPDVETRNRKPLQQPAAFGATWELRLGPNNRFRVLYEFDLDRREVQILAIGIKEGNRLFVAGEEIEL